MAVALCTRSKRRLMQRLGAALTLTLAACGDGGSTTPGATCSATPAALPSTDVTFTLEAAHRFQTMQGFGTTQRLFDDPHTTETFDASTSRAAAIPSPTEQDKILDMLYVDLGLTRMRFHPEGLEPVNDNGDPESTDLSKFNFGWKGADGHIAAVTARTPRGLTTYYASPLTVESWMDESNPDEYVEWAMAMLRHWRKQGLVMPYFSLMNEPGYYGGTKSWSGAWLRDVTKRLGARLRAEGFSTKLVAPDDISPMKAYERLQVILADPVARQYIGAVAYHLYDRGGEDRVKQLAQQYGLPIWMSEYSTPGDWQAWAALMHELIVEHDVSAVDYMWGFFGDWDRSQLISLLVNGSSYRGFSLNRHYHVMGQYSRYVRPGAVRIGATTSDPEVRVAAFLEGTKTIVVATNLSARDRTVRMELGSAASCGTNVATVRSSESESWKELPSFTLDQPRFAAAVPAGSVTTFVVQ